MTDALDPATIAEALGDLPGRWSFEDDRLQTELTFDDFRAAIDFMAELAPAIDAADHHPEWTNVYNSISVRLTTHDAGDKVTDKDLALASLIAERYRQATAKG